MRKIKSLFLTILIMSLMMTFMISSVKVLAEKAVKSESKVEKSKESKTLEGESESSGEEGEVEEKTEEELVEEERIHEAYKEMTGDIAKGEAEEPEDFREINGWQTPFTVLAILFFIAISLNLLPKIAAKELGGHHD